MSRPNPLITGLLDAAYVAAGAASLTAQAVAGRWEAVRDHLRRRAFTPVPERTGERPCLWIHGVSVGEVLTARPLLREFDKRCPGWDVLVSASTRLGVEAARKHYADRTVVSCPLDLGVLVGRTFRRLRPDALVIVEHDLWPNLIRYAVAAGVPVALVNARLSPRSLRGYRRLSRVYRWPPRELSVICVQDETSAARFRELGHDATKVRVTGNLKFDGPLPEVSAAVRTDMGFTAEDWVLLGGSTHEGEEEALLDAFQAVRARRPSSWLVLAPRRIERTPDVQKLVAARGFTSSLWSAGRRRGPDVIVVDTMGELAGLNGAADLVFVGGTLAPIGGHNVIEPAALGKPTIIGPHYANARSVVERFLESSALAVVDDPASLTREVLALSEDRERARELGRRARDTVEASRGAAARTLDELAPVLEGVPGSGRHP